MTIDPISATLEDRIKAALFDGAKSADIASLIREAKAAASVAYNVAKRALFRALDPALSAPDAAAARHESEDAAVSSLADGED